MTEREYTVAWQALDDAHTSIRIAATIALKNAVTNAGSVFDEDKVVNSVEVVDGKTLNVMRHPYG